MHTIRSRFAPPPPPPFPLPGPIVVIVAVHAGLTRRGELVRKELVRQCKVVDGIIIYTVGR